MVAAVGTGIPQIVRILFMCSFFWLSFAIAGVQLFGGKFYKCVDTIKIYPHNVVDYDLIPNKAVCLHNNLTWLNSPMNFDHIGNAYLSLFQVATFRGWLNIMRDATDSTEVICHTFFSALNLTLARI